VSDPTWDVPAWRIGDLLVIEPGMGPGLTSAILPDLEGLGRGGVWLFGWCGGLRPELSAGDLVLADATISQAENGLITRVAHPPSDPLLGEVRILVTPKSKRRARPPYSWLSWSGRGTLG
jgi:hypothetical protein